MTEYHFHWRAPDGGATLTPGVRIQAESDRHGAALALRTFMRQGCDLTSPLAHLDLTDASGRHTLLVDEIVDWLNEPNQAAFVEREGLAVLLQ